MQKNHPEERTAEATSLRVSFALSLFSFYGETVSIWLKIKNGLEWYL